MRRRTRVSKFQSPGFGFGTSDHGIRVLPRLDGLHIAFFFFFFSLLLLLAFCDAEAKVADLGDLGLHSSGAPTLLNAPVAFISVRNGTTNSFCRRSMVATWIHAPHNCRVICVNDCVVVCFHWINFCSVCSLGAAPR